jgi:hypothetical protein
MNMASAAGHPNPEELAAYGDGEASAEVSAHVAGCWSCTERVASYAQTEQGLRQSLYRFDCPSPQTLGDYQFDLLDETERVSVAGHATDCDLCQLELKMLRAYLAEPTPVPDSMVQRVRRVVAALFTPAPGLAYAGLRGAVQTGTRVFEAGDVTVTVGRGQAPGTLIGLVVVHAVPPEALTGREARLVDPAGGTPISAVLDDLGNFEFADVAAGVYLLEVDLADSLVVIEELRLD